MCITTLQGNPEPGGPGRVPLQGRLYLWLRGEVAGSRSAHLPVHGSLCAPSPAGPAGLLLPALPPTEGLLGHSGQVSWTGRGKRADPDFFVGLRRDIPSWATE